MNQFELESSWLLLDLYALFRRETGLTEKEFSIKQYVHLMQLQKDLADGKGIQSVVLGDGETAEGE